MRRRKYNILFLVICIFVVAAFALTIAYAALRTNLNVNFGNITQSALTWDVKINSASLYSSTSTNATKINCSAPSYNNTTISGINVKFTKFGDRCVYTFSVKNNGTISAKITSISMKNPTGVSCVTNSTSIVCGDITYSLKYSSSSTSTYVPAIGNSLGAGSTRTFYLIVEYTGASSATSNFSHSNFGATVNYGQN